MSRNRWTQAWGHLTFLCFAGAFFVASADAKSSAAVKEAFASIQQAAKAGKEYAGDKLFTKAAFQYVNKEDVPKVQAATLEAIAVAQYLSDDTKGTAAVVTTKTAAGQAEVRMQQEGGTWKIASPRLYETRSEDLTKRNGTKPATASLKLRRSTPYASSAMSFHRASNAAKSCGNRVDIWVCPSKAIHVGGNSTIIDLGKATLKRTHGIGIGGEGAAPVAIEVGHTYRVHCVDKRERDFFVAFRVKRLKSKTADIEWRLLSTGWGAPADIHTATKREPGGEDGEDALCDRH